MDEKLNDLLIQEINKSIEGLNGNKEQLIEELKKYEGRYGALEKTELEQDLGKIDSELEEKRLDKAKIETRREIMAQIKEEQARADKEYQKLLKEREDCKAEIKGLEGKKEFVNGVLVTTKEQQEFEKDLEKINDSIAKFEKLKIQHTKDLNEHSAVIEELLKKYNIREKNKDKQNVPVSETQQEPIVQTTVEETDGTVTDNGAKTNEKEETIIVEGPSDNEEQFKETDARDVLDSIDKSLGELNDSRTQNTQKSGIVVPKEVKQQESETNKSTTQEPAKKQEIIAPEDSKRKEEQEKTSKDSEPAKEEKTNGAETVTVNPTEFFKGESAGEKICPPKKIEDITCSVIGGKLVYTISGINEDGKQFSVSRETTPKRLTSDEKKSISKKVNKYSVGNIDAQIYRILKNDNLFRSTNLVEEYMDLVDRLSSIGEEAKDDDMMIRYDLQNLNKSELSFLQKGQVKNIARRNFIDGIAEYIKPKSKFREFIDRFKMKLLSSGEKHEPKHEKDGLMTNEQRIELLYDTESKDKDFDFEQFCEVFKVTPEEKANLMAKEKTRVEQNKFQASIKSSVDYSKLPKQPEQTEEQQSKDDRDEQSL